MNIIIEKPPAWIYDECVKLFGIDKRKGVVWTLGQNIFNPDNVVIPDHLLIHEQTHSDQQSNDDIVGKSWWAKYLTDQKFRLDQEIMAYHNQYLYICSKIKDRNARYRNLHILASDLCGDMYGRIISYTDAIRRIKD